MIPWCVVHGPTIRILSLEGRDIDKGNKCSWAVHIAEYKGNLAGIVYNGRDKFGWLVQQRRVNVDNIRK